MTPHHKISHKCSENFFEVLADYDRIIFPEHFGANIFKIFQPVAKLWAFKSDGFIKIETEKIASKVLQY